ncbi:MAG: LemA family protein [Terriglobales bacterium]
MTTTDLRRQRGAMKPWLIVLIVIAVIGVGCGSSFVGRYNQMVAMREQVRQQWSQVDVAIKRRADLIPNLVNTVKGFAAQEQKVIGEVTDARAALGGARNPKDTIAANNQLDGALSRLLVIVENYPNLKSNANFLALQDELAGSENRIAVERRKYNQALQVYNTAISTFPNSLVARLGGFGYNSDYFQASAGERAAPPTVDFSK